MNNWHEYLTSRFQAIIVKKIPGSNEWNSRWQSQYKVNARVWVYKYSVNNEIYYMVWAGQYDWGGFKLDEATAKECLRAVRVNGKVLFETAEEKAKLDDIANWNMSR